jgi:hypothetical protein
MRIIDPVKRLCLIVLILLLPLRGWTADAMAVAMGMHGLAAASAQAALSDMPADCPMLSIAGQAAADGSVSGTGKTCNTCQLCMGVAAPFAVAVEPTMSDAASAPAHRPAAFISADLALSAKPPAL